MAALDFPNSPTTNQQYAAPNGVTYQWDGAAWVVTGGPPGQLWTGTGTTLTPTDPTKIVAVPGSPGATNAALILGTRTAKFRALTDMNAVDWAGWAINHHAAPEVPAQSSWLYSLSSATDGSDTFLVQRRAPGAAAGTVTTMLSVDAPGKLYVPGSNDAVDQAAVLFGQRAQKGRLIAIPGFDYLAVTRNRRFTGGAWARDDTAQPSWTLAFTNTDTCNIDHENAAGAVTTLLTVDNAGNMGISGATATKASGTTWANPSDKRIKKNVAPYAQGLAAVVALEPKMFEYNGLGGSQDGLAGIGLIADDVQPVMPEMVTTTAAKLNPDDDTPVDLLTLDTTALTMALVNAVKELAAELATLKAATAAPAPANA